MNHFPRLSGFLYLAPFALCTAVLLGNVRSPNHAVSCPFVLMPAKNECGAVPSYRDCHRRIVSLQICLHLLTLLCLYFMAALYKKELDKFARTADARIDVTTQRIMDIANTVFVTLRVFKEKVFTVVVNLRRRLSEPRQITVMYLVQCPKCLPWHHENEHVSSARVQEVVNGYPEFTLRKSHQHQASAPPFGFPDACPWYPEPRPRRNTFQRRFINACVAIVYRSR